LKGARALALLALAVGPVACASGAKPRTSAEVLLNERMAAVLLRDGRAAEAEQAYRDVVKSDPRNAEVRDGLGVALLMQNKLRDSLDEFDRAVKYGPEKALYRIHRGMARTRVGRYEEAEEDFRAAESVGSPEDRQDVCVHRGELRQRQGDFAGAEAEFTNALAFDPKSFSALLGRGVARESRSNYAGAAEDYLECVRLQPKSPEANLRLGLVLVTLKRNSLGRKYLERTIELDPTGDAAAKARMLLESTPSS
jgi:tetratricopeptide (TPR) repeat protein